MNKYRLYNNVAGWFTFAIAAVVYLLTIESTASFWDCGEFIAASYKQMVGHPPGAPFFLIVGRLFTLFAGNNVEMVPVMINAMSALASAFTILFLFWSITHLARKIIIKTEEDYNLTNYIIVFGSGLVGALAYTFSDSFWFSAVEGEVYGTSSFFTAIVFWAILKWEESADEPGSNRWLVLIAYLMGLSIGVHLLNLLAIPAIVFVYYFKKFNVTKKGIIIAGVLSIAILGIVMYAIISGAIWIATLFELGFVNGLGLPLNSGLFFYILLLVSALVYGIWYSYKRGKVILNTILICVSVLVLGYSSYAMIMIRSNAKPPMNQNNPSNLFSLLYYLNREQYGDRPLLNGQNYNSPVKDVVEKSPVYSPVNGRYEIVNHKQEYIYHPQFITAFPRMYSSDGDHVRAYQSWVKIKGTPMKYQDEEGKQVTVNKPTVSENLKFFFRYQIGFMYMRYFMWNFAGRQNDLQGNGELNKGNWISGISFIDDARLGPQEKLPEYLKKNNARNKYYLLPLLLGLVGFWFQFKKHKKDFTVVMLLFIMTGLAIVVYLNQTPYQPRERDYAYSGSFFAYAIWIGLGVAAIMDALKKSKNVVTASLVSAGCLVVVPINMAKENWNDHDRSGRYTSRDFAYNYLNSCDKNAILFTNGDNDTFPLWYAQEVEGIRTDVRVVNLSYLSADWYIEQMCRKAYLSDPIPTSFKPADYVQGKNDIAFLIDKSTEFVELNDAINFIKSDDPRKGAAMGNNRQNYLPTVRLKLKVNAQDAVVSGTVRPEMAPQIVPEMKWELIQNIDQQTNKKNYRRYLTKSDLMILDMVNANQWKRPMYFAVTVSRENYQGLDNYFLNCGLAYRIVPVVSQSSGISSGGVDTKTMYDNMMNKFKWGNAADPHVYLDENNTRMFSNMRIYFADLASKLIMEGKKDSARKVLDRCLSVIPASKIEHNYFSIPTAENFYKLNEGDKANGIVKEIARTALQELQYIQKIPRAFASSGNPRKNMGYKNLTNDLQMNLYIGDRLINIAGYYGQDSLRKELELKFQPHFSAYQQ